MPIPVRPLKIQSAGLEKILLVPCTVTKVLPYINDFLSGSVCNKGICFSSEAISMLHGQGTWVSYFSHHNANCSCNQGIIWCT